LILQDFLPRSGKRGLPKQQQARRLPDRHHLTHVCKTRLECEMAMEYYELTAKGRVAFDDEGWMDSLEIDSAFMLTQVQEPVPVNALQGVNAGVVEELEQDGYIHTVMLR
jgi:hypothetical protein